MEIVKALKKKQGSARNNIPGRQQAYLKDFKVIEIKDLMSDPLEFSARKSSIMPTN
jgi:hypothetical protein